ncbi:MAG: DUF6285 domain-containing protein [Mycobacterium sp.]
MRTPNDSARLRPTSTDLLAVVATFLESQILPAVSDRYGNAEVRAAVDALRVVQRDLLGDSRAAADARNALAGLGFSDEAQLAAAIRDGKLDDRTEDVATCLRALVNGRLAVDHPGYQDE